MTEFMRPTVTTEEVSDTVARFIVEPLERGYGNTLGNCFASRPALVSGRR